MKHSIDAYHTLGIDIAKRSIAMLGAHTQGKLAYKSTCSRNKLLAELTTVSPCQFFMEAHGGAHQLAREFQTMGHDVGLIAPIYVICRDQRFHPIKPSNIAASSLCVVK